jgi:hypothetical protein
MPEKTKGAQTNARLQTASLMDQARTTVLRTEIYRLHAVVCVRADRCLYLVAQPSNFVVERAQRVVGA